MDYAYLAARLSVQYVSFTTHLLSQHSFGIALGAALANFSRSTHYSHLTEGSPHTRAGLRNADKTKVTLPHIILATVVSPRFLLPPENCIFVLLLSTLSRSFRRKRSRFSHIVAFTPSKPR
jgi:hypothetical protein